VKVFSSKRVSESCSDNRQSKSGTADENRKWVWELDLAILHHSEVAVVAGKQLTNAVEFLQQQ